MNPCLHFFSHNFHCGFSILRGRVKRTIHLNFALHTQPRRSFHEKAQSSEGNPAHALKSRGAGHRGGQSHHGIRPPAGRSNRLQLFRHLRWNQLQLLGHLLRQLQWHLRCHLQRHLRDLRHHLRHGQSTSSLLATALIVSFLFQRSGSWEPLLSF
jgi:hypothetical protein